jgi:hypothetical protein
MGQHRHTRPAAEIIAGQRRQPCRLLTALRHRPAKPQRPRTTIRRHRCIPIRVDLEIHECMGVFTLLHLLAPPSPCPPTGGGPGGGGAVPETVLAAGAIEAAGAVPGAAIAATAAGAVAATGTLG